MIAADNLDALDETQLRQTVRRLRVELQHKSALLDKLTQEMAVLKRLSLTMHGADSSADSDPAKKKAPSVDVR